ncbi:hypothetical protein E5K02_09760 [Hymenobacter metallicola]|uniref:T9SS type A sorting domain-containing protein n=1 Tax=Hymenobacter metallicola TaxID=2563114 RepID=A0A4Z0QL00_9BACT|nr:hypothetical protein E5K02_09760 [Hymenobacter metallicola]
MLLLALAMASSAHAQSQTCALRFNTQEELNNYLGSGTRCSTAQSIFIRGYNRNADGTPDGGVTDVSGLLHITAVTGDVIIQKNLLASLAGLNDIGTVGGVVHIQSGVGTFDDFPFLVSAGGVAFSGTSFTEIRGFGLLSSAGEVYISQNSALRSVNAFNNLRTLTSRLTITNNPLLDRISTFGALTAAADIQVQSNPQLQAIVGFNALRSLGSVNITVNDALRTISGFNGGLVATGQVGIMENPVLETLSGFDNSDVSLVNISRNPRLKEIANFNNSRFGVSIAITYNAGLEQITGFRSMAAPPRDLSISQNVLLDSISGFTGATAPTNLAIDDNPALRTLTQGLTFTTYSTLNYLYLRNNSSLTGCNVPWLCQHLVRGGGANISGNATGCSEAAIRQACTTLAARPVATKRPAPFPNPTDDMLQLPVRGAYRVSDLAGRVLLHGTGFQVSLAELPTGLYLVHTGADFQDRFRIVKR